jgi:hypothetical protein
MNKYKCKDCRYKNFSIFEFPCDACYGGSWYEAEEGSVDGDEYEPIEGSENE